MSLPSPSATATDASSSADGALRLAHTGLIRAAGADAAAFLNGQLTNDFSGLGLGDVRLAAYCSPKGRMLASLIGFKHAHDELWLACRREVLPATLKRLRMFVLRAKAVLSEADDSVSLLGLAGPSVAAHVADAATLPVWKKLDLPEGGHLVRLPDGAGQPRWLWAGPSAAAESLLAALPALPAERWDWLEVCSGIAPVLAATSEAFVPQMLNYELVGGVNFQKGCYPGQEIVARSQYRGTLKRRAVLLHGDEAPAVGQELYWSGDADQPSGLIALAAPAPSGGYDAIAEIKLAALDGGSLHLGAPGGPPLARRPLPYPLPAGTER
ncbi:MAG TPA: folate-binding protein [Methylibium sp.]|nr:folate-binding protein [Methylibium sp.]